MILKQILDVTTWTDLITIKNRYPNFINYVLLRYGNFESRYPQEIFKDLFTAIIINNQTELSMGETLVSNTLEKLDNDKLGDVSTSVTQNVSKRDNENVSSYSGYNVDGDFAKNRNNGNTKHDATIKATNINYFEYLTTMNNTRFRDTWKHINKQVLALCVTIKNLE